MHRKNDLRGKVVVVTGGNGFLGTHFCSILSENGAIPIIIDHKKNENCDFDCYRCDITDDDALKNVCKKIEEKHLYVDVLINNAANNPKLDNGKSVGYTHFEDISLDHWNSDLAVGVTGAMLCTKHFGAMMAKHGRGSIINIGSVYSDLAAPNQSIYETPKPVTYNVVKAAIVGLTKYTATYWSKRGVRCNCVSFSGIFNNQPSGFVEKYSKLCPMNRMMNLDETSGIILYLASDASSFVNGANIVVDGGMTSW